MQRYFAGEPRIDRNKMFQDNKLAEFIPQPNKNEKELSWRMLIIAEVMMMNLTTNAAFSVRTVQKAPGIDCPSWLR